MNVCNRLSLCAKNWSFFRKG